MKPIPAEIELDGSPVYHRADIYRQSFTLIFTSMGAFLELPIIQNLWTVGGSRSTRGEKKTGIGRTFPPEALTGWGGHGNLTAPPQRNHQTPHFPGVGSKPRTETCPSAESVSQGNLD